MLFPGAEGKIHTHAPVARPVSLVMFLQRKNIIKKRKPTSQTGMPIPWRRRRDLNSRAGYPTYTLSRGASSPLEYFCIVKINVDIQLTLSIGDK